MARYGVDPSFATFNDDRQRGATAVEYGLLVALIAAICIATVILLGEAVRDSFQSVKWW